MDERQEFSDSKSSDKICFTFSMNLPPWHRAQWMQQDVIDISRIFAGNRDI